MLVTFRVSDVTWTVPFGSDEGFGFGLEPDPPGEDLGDVIVLDSAELGERQ